MRRRGLQLRRPSVLHLGTTERAAVAAAAVAAAVPLAALAALHRDSHAVQSRNLQPDDGRQIH